MIMVLLMGGPLICTGQTTNIAVTPSADTFLRSLAPASNYGSAGAISVSGSAAVNGSGQQNGLSDSLLRFPVSNIVAVAEAAFGSNDWIITRATLRLVELGAPANALFNRGVGAFEIRWIVSDAWVEGTGTPTAPTTNGVAYTNLPSVLNAGSDVSLGVFTNGGVDGAISFRLGLASSFVSDIRAGGDVSFYLTAASATVGFTADSRSFNTPSAWPSLEFTIARRPLPVLSIRAGELNTALIVFETVSNWTYVLQGTMGLNEGWSNLMTVAAQPTNASVLFLDGTSNSRRFYRLMLAQ